MKVKYGGGDDARVKVNVRSGQAEEWRKMSETETERERHTEREEAGDGMEGGEVEVDVELVRPLPEVPVACSVEWEEGDLLVVRVVLPPGAGAGDCCAEVEPPAGSGAGGRSGGSGGGGAGAWCSHLILEAPGLPASARIALPAGADDDSVSVRLVKKPQRALVVRLHCPLPPPPTPPPQATLLLPPPRQPPPPPPPSPPPTPQPTPLPPPPPPAPASTPTLTPTPTPALAPTSASKHAPVPAPASAPAPAPALRAGAKDCVGVGGTLSWTAATEFSPLPPVPPRAPRAAPRGVDLRDAEDWEDFVQVRWAIAGREEEQPVVTPAALDGLSFPVTLAWALQQPPIIKAVADARAAVAAGALAGSTADVAAGAAAAAAENAAAAGAAGAAGAGAVAENGAAALGDGKGVPLTILIAGASAFTEQYLLEHTRYWEEVWRSQSITPTPATSSSAI